MKYSPPRMAAGKIRAELPRFVLMLSARFVIQNSSLCKAKQKGIPNKRILVVF